MGVVEEVLEVVGVVEEVGVKDCRGWVVEVVGPLMAPSAPPAVRGRPSAGQSMAVPKDTLDTLLMIPSAATFPLSAAGWRGCFADARAVVHRAVERS
ncbi:unnamed protein product [Arctogadus glacialis]